MDSTTAPVSDTTNAHLARAFAALTRDLVNPMSESSDDVFRPFYAPMSPLSQVSPETFRAAVGIGRRYTIDLSSGDDFFSTHTDPDEGDAESALVYACLEKLMQAVLTDLSVAFARGENVVRVRTYIFGRAENGGLVGLRTMSTET